MLSIAGIGADLKPTLLAKLEQHLCRISADLETFVFVGEIKIKEGRKISVYVYYATNTTKSALVEAKLTKA
ncbi:MAG: hypothetical protein ACU83U_14585 [Gammaproteobacteria bacterium]